MRDSKQRFSDRVDDYVKYRPAYPPEVLGFLRSECGFGPGHVVADVGSGTGIFTRQLLENGNKVFAVEPNGPMRAAAEQALSGFPNFVSVAAPAEATGLPDASVDFVTAAQAFHWFDAARARAEFARVLRPGGWVALLWNSRGRRDSGFGLAYEKLLHEHGIDYEKLIKGWGDANGGVTRFFGAGGFRLFTCPNGQSFDFDGLRGRALSASYVPKPGAPGHEPLMTGLRAAFDRFHRDGRIVLEYETLVYLGRLEPR
jgi:SAM-dependent methyltransferase